ncbi:translation initiation factor eIF-3b like protein [Physocladia obscura]|uniref:Translation initiation factor eIF-3b like protein n=1 Tax=Physocladia obscura TaxID=109957 RepID=A0AAD5TAV7_9FUNG|nr:translation initiation factor eIF-3b like protein [Physocladia obscura]
MGLLNKKSIKIENVQAFEWSPTENVISYWKPEPDVGNIPACVTLMKLPHREIVRTKNLFNVVNAQLAWQSAGNIFLHNLEVFRKKEKDVRVDVIELNATEKITGVFWEPNGDRFALIGFEGTAKINSHFYERNAAPPAGKKNYPTISAILGGARFLKTLDRKGINQVVWSPKGRIAVLAGVRAFQGDIEFWDLTMLAAGNHYTCTDLEWDPTGRPRPPTPLTGGKQKTVKKNFKEINWLKESDLHNEILGIDGTSDSRTQEIEEYVDEIIEEIEEVVLNNDDGVND